MGTNFGSALKDISPTRTTLGRHAGAKPRPCQVERWETQEQEPSPGFVALTGFLKSQSRKGSAPPRLYSFLLPRMWLFPVRRWNLKSPAPITISRHMQQFAVTLAEEREYFTHDGKKDLDELHQKCALYFDEGHHEHDHKLLKYFEEGYSQVMSQRNLQAQQLNLGPEPQLEAQRLGLEPRQLALELQLGAKWLASDLSEACYDMTSKFIVNELTLSKIIDQDNHKKTLEQLNESSQLL